MSVLSSDAFTEDDWKLVQLLLTLFRNILAVRDISVQKAEESANHLLSLRDKFLELLSQENVMDLIIVFTQHVGGHCSYLRQDNLLLLETFHYIFLDQDPESIAKTRLTTSKVDGDAEVCIESLRSIMEQEKQKKKLIRSCTLGRHSQFSGIFTSFTMDGSRTLSKGIPASASSDIQFKPQKVQRGPMKKTLPNHGKLPTMKRMILEMLYDFLNQFLAGAYNVLMQSICEDIEKEHPGIQNSDVLVFFQLAQFVTTFQYHKCLMGKTNVEDHSTESHITDDGDSTLFKGEICGPIAASVNEPMFELVGAKWRYAFEGLKETKNFKFLSAAGSLMKIMIRMLDLVLKVMPEDCQETQTASVILYKLFYDQTDQGLTQFLLSLIKSFDTLKQPKSDLADLVEMIHLVLRLMENLQARGTLRVSRKARKRRKKHVVDDRPNKVHETAMDQVTTEINVSGHQECTDVSPSERDLINSGSDQKEETFSIAFPVNEPKISAVEPQNQGSSLPQTDDRELNDINADVIHASCGDDSSSDEQIPQTDEVDFKISPLLGSLASHSVVTNFCWLLKFYKTNSPSTNHYIVRMLQRICDDLNLSPMLYQLSYLCIFYDILDEQKSYPCKEHEHIVDFLTILARRMLRKMKNQPLLFVEVLFPKSRRDCHLINTEFMKQELSDLKKGVQNWRYGSEDHDAGPSQEKEMIHRSLADALGDDEYDVVVSSEHDNEKEEDLEEDEGDAILHVSSDSACKSTERLISVSGSRDDGSENDDIAGTILKDNFGRVSKRKKRLVLNDKLEEKVRNLYEKYKGDRHYSRLIAEALDQDGNLSTVQVSNICRKLGLRVPSRKRPSHAGQLSSDSNDPCKADMRINDVILPDSSTLEGNSLLRRPLQTRKRVRAFDENQELMIRNLFEQFKDHKKCSQMIANALNPDRMVTAAQVSRKLKKLGLLTSQGKRSKTNTILRDEDSDDASIEGKRDNQTLSSLKKRTAEDNVLVDKDASDPNAGGESTANNSDDEMLSSVLKKSRRIQLTRKEKLTNSSTPLPIPGTGSKKGIARGSDERDQRGQLIEPGTAETNTAGARGPNSPSFSSENGTPGLAGNRQLLQDYDDLADSGEDMTPSVSPKNLASRRKLRMVIDLEDEE
ncbi:hypothetical protein Ancab_009861 [Ancistrocladus abbreviatus]